MFSVHTTPEEFENGAFTLLPGISSFVKIWDPRLDNFYKGRYAREQALPLADIHFFDL